MSEEVRTIPVPNGWSIEQAWESIQRGESLPTKQGYWWANIIVSDGKLVKVVA